MDLKSLQDEMVSRHDKEQKDFCKLVLKTLAEENLVLFGWGNETYNDDGGTDENKDYVILDDNLEKLKKNQAWFDEINFSQAFDDYIQCDWDQNAYYKFTLDSNGEINVKTPSSEEIEVIEDSMY